PLGGHDGVAGLLLHRQLLKAVVIPDLDLPEPDKQRNEYRHAKDGQQDQGAHQDGAVGPVVGLLDDSSVLSLCHDSPRAFRGWKYRKGCKKIPFLTPSHLSVYQGRRAARLSFWGLQIMIWPHSPEICHDFLRNGFDALEHALTARGPALLRDNP